MYQEFVRSVMNKLNDEVVSFKAAISTSELEKQTNEPQF
jgi:hypothetical protein